MADDEKTGMRESVPSTTEGALDAGSLDSGELDALLSRLHLIEDQPLADRAPAFVQLHDELRRALEGADAPSSRE